MPVKSLTAEQMLDYLQTNVHRDGDCLIWAGQVHKKTGAPRIGWNGQSHLARRLLLRLLGSDPGRKSVTSSCESRQCMNRAHLVTLRHGELLRRAARQGHWQVGAIRSMRAAVGKISASKLPITEAREVLRRRAAGETFQSIGDRYGVHATRVHSALKAWARAGVRL